MANESETDRHSVNSQVSEAALRELYLLPFEICVDDAAPVDADGGLQRRQRRGGHRAGRAQQRVLKSEWAWDGLLMSDWGATKTAGPAATVAWTW